MLDLEQTIRRLAWLARWSASAHLIGGVLAAALMIGIGLFRDDYKLLWFLAAATALVDALGWSRTVRDIAHRGWTRTSRRRTIETRSQRTTVARNTGKSFDFETSDSAHQPI